MPLKQTLQTRLNRLKPAAIPKPPAPGVYHFMREKPGEKTRMHLRLEPDGCGLLLVNASRAYTLNPTAACMAWFYLNGAGERGAISALTRKFNVPHREAELDYRDFTARFDDLVAPNGGCPICDLGLDTAAPFSSRPSAPYRMDLALTYRCNNDCAHCYNALPRKREELTTDEWKRILAMLWDVGIPHIVFTGGEPTLRADLPDLVAHAQHLGQITGLNTNARRLQDPAFVKALVDAGLDHVQITLESHDPAIHDHMVSAPGAWHQTVQGLKNALASRLFVMTNTTLLKWNAPSLVKTLDFLAELGVPTLGLNALIYSGKGSSVGTGLAESELPALLEVARKMTGLHGQKLIWYTPTQYCHFDPIQLELGVKGCTAALYNMCIEPDGGVIPCQSYYQSLGSMLRTPWEQIWNHPLAVSLRERSDVPQACRSCALLPECGGGCPLARDVSDEFKPAPVAVLDFPQRNGGF